MFALPFSCSRPTQESAKYFAALPYDVFDRKEAKAYCKAHPKSFLCIDRPETNFDDDQDMYADIVYETGKKLLDQAEADRTLIQDTTPCYYIYELTQDGRSQTGIVSAVAVSDYEDQTILRHENTTRKKEEDRVRHIRALGAQTGPIFLAYRKNDLLKKLIVRAKQDAPIISFTDEFDVEQRIWRISKTDQTQAFFEAFKELEHAYIADGHHRCASAVRVSQELGAKRSSTPLIDDADKVPAAYFLAVLFDADELHILPYNRLVLDSCQKTLQDILEEFDACGVSVVGPLESFSAPGAGQASFYAEGSWYRIGLPELTGQTVSSTLDTERLQKSILEPIFNIDDPRTNERIRFVGGIVGPCELAEMCELSSKTASKLDKGISCAFYMYPTSINQLMSISDAGELMPPKSTWFEPKLRSGLFIRHIH